MEDQTTLLSTVYDGWDGYNTSLIRAVGDLTPEQLAWRPGDGWRSVGEVAAHIALGRVEWFGRMGAPGCEELAESIERAGWGEEKEGLVRLLAETWRMVEGTLNAWTVGDLAKTYLHKYQGKTYAVSRQWTIWRIMAHDIHHGGQITTMLAMQGVVPLELGALGGHITEPAVVG